MIETILYLDAYPCSAEALDYYHKLLAEKNKIEALLSENGYPLVAQNIQTFSASPLIGFPVIAPGHLSD